MDTLSWVPVPSTVTALPAAPAVVDNTPSRWRGFVAAIGTTPQATLNAAFPDPQSGDGVQDETSLDVWKYNGSLWVNIGSDIGPKVTFDFLIPLYNELLICESGTSTGIAVQSFNYSLAQLESVSLATRTGIVGVTTLLVSVPSAGVQLAGVPPTVVLDGGQLTVPTAGLAIAGIAPVVATSAVVPIPAAAIALAGIAPTVSAIGAGGVELPVPAGALTVAVAVPGVSVGSGGAAGGDGSVFWGDWAYREDDVLLFADEETIQGSSQMPWRTWAWSEDGATLLSDE